MSDHYQRLEEFYASGPMPWDQADPPPEGLALDVGCAHSFDAAELTAYHAE